MATPEQIEQDSIRGRRVRLAIRITVAGPLLWFCVMGMVHSLLHIFGHGAVPRGLWAWPLMVAPLFNLAGLLVFWQPERRRRIFWLSESITSGAVLLLALDMILAMAYSPVAFIGVVLCVLALVGLLAARLGWLR